MEPVPVTHPRRIAWRLIVAATEALTLAVNAFPITAFDNLMSLPLRGELAGWWSRRIDSANRIVYRVSKNELELLQCGGHYRD